MDTNYKYVNTCQEPLALCSTTYKDKFWLDDPTELYKNNNYLIFFPKYEMSQNEQLNAISRLCIYMIILMILFDRGEYYIYIPITILIMVVIINKIDILDKLRGNKELTKILNIRSEDDMTTMEQFKNDYAPDIPKKYKTYEERIAEEEEANKDTIIKTGFYDSNGDLQLGTQDNPSTKGTILESNKTYFTVDEMNDYNRNTCRKPTEDNPLMNTPAVNYGLEDEPVACNSNDDDINESIRVNFNHELFRDVDELWDKKNSQRQFYTMPNTAIPNNQTEFARWLYERPAGTMCKDEDMSKCIKFYDDLRYRPR